MPVTDPRLRARLAEMLELNLADDVLAWELARRRHLAQDPDGRRRLHPPRAPGAGHRAGAQLLTTVVASTSSSERELKFAPGSVVPDARRSTATTSSRADAPDTDPTARRLLRHRRPPPRARGREPALPQRRGLDGEAARCAADGALVRSELHVDGEPRRSARRARSTSCARSSRRAPLAARGAAQHRAAPTSCCATSTATQLAEVVDDEVSVLDGARLAARFRELEVEFADDGAAELVDAASPTGCAPPAPASPSTIPKIVRALGPRALDPPDLVAAADARLRVDAARGAAGRDRAFDRAPARPRPGRAPRRATPRTCTRRGSRPAGCAPTCARSAACVDPDWDEPLRDELKWLGGAARRGARRRRAARPARGAPRRAAAAPTVDAGERAARRSARATRSRARAELLDAMRSERYLDAARPARAPRRAPSRRRGRRRRRSSSSSATSCGSRGRSSAARSTRSTTTRPTRSCTRCASGPSGAGTRPRRWRPRSARRPSASPRRSPTCRRCSASTRTRWSPGSGCASHAPTAAARECAFVAGRARRARGRRRAARRAPSGRTAWKRREARRSSRRWM